jgi:glycosyltransferase involved in cell wall biosynthesis
MTNSHPAVDIVLPVHNEAASIGQTLEEFHRVVAVEGGIPIRFVVCEDGSRDNSVAVLKELSLKLPILLISEPTRKGYSRAVIDGFLRTEAPLVGFIDSDGQCEPKDFAKFYEAQATGDFDLVFGYRNPRHDHIVRILMSGAFAIVYRMLFQIPLKDPSCPFLLIRREGLLKVLKGNLGILKQGFWWEFCARCIAAQLRIKELPVAHRTRTSGQTQVYLPSKVPGIAWEHLKGLFRLRKELDSMGK